MSVPRLPHEILHMIYHIYLEHMLGARCTLLLVCRNWYQLIINDPTIWREISWCQAPPPSHKAAPFRATFLGLAPAIAHTASVLDGSTTFSLTAGPLITTPTVENITPLLGEDMFTRCSTIILVSSIDSPTSGSTLLATLLVLSQAGTTNFSSLVYLELRDADLDEPGDALIWFFSLIEHSARNLRRLGIMYTCATLPTSILEALGSHRGICDRILSLRSSTYSSLVPYITFPNLEHLDFTSIDYLIVFRRTNLSQLVSPHLSSPRLKGDFFKAHLPPPTIIKQLDRLELVEFPTYHVLFLYELMLEGNGGGPVGIQWDSSEYEPVTIDRIIRISDGLAFITVTLIKQ